MDDAQQLFCEACRTGDLEEAQRIYHISSSDNSIETDEKIDIHANEESAFCNACENGHLEVAQWLYRISIEINSMVDIHVINKCAFRWACENGHLEVAQWLYQISKEMNSIENESAIACAKAQTHSIDNEEKTYSDDYDSSNKFLFAHAQKLNIHADYEGALLYACLNGHLEVAQWLYHVSFETGNMIDIHVYNDSAFRSACYNGHLEVAQWLYHVSFTSKDTIDDLKETYAINSIDSKDTVNIHANDEWAFRRACANGHLHVSKWLYKLSVDKNDPINFHEKNDWAFFMACSNGHLHIVKWLYQISIEMNSIVDIHANNEYAFRKVCLNRHLDVAQWLYQISIEINSIEMKDTVDIHACEESQDMLHHLCVEHNRSRLNTNRFFRLFIDKL